MADILLSEGSAEPIAFVGDRAWIRTWGKNAAGAAIASVPSADAVEPGRRAIAVYRPDRFYDVSDAIGTSKDLTLGYWSSLPVDPIGSFRIISNENEVDVPQSPYDRLRAEFKEFALNVASRSDVDRLSAEVALLGARVSKLASILNRDVANESPSMESYYETIGETPLTLTGYVDSTLIKSALSSENALINLLKSIADENLHAVPEVASIAEQHLRADNAVLRAAAGRALSATAPSRAIALLPEAISNETNKVAKSLLRGALRAAQG